MSFVLLTWALEKHASHVEHVQHNAFVLVHTSSPQKHIKNHLPSHWIRTFSFLPHQQPEITSIIKLEPTDLSHNSSNRDHRKQQTQNRLTNKLNYANNPRWVVTGSIRAMTASKTAM